MNDESGDDNDPKNTITSELQTDDLTLTSNDQNYGESDRLRSQHLKSLLGSAGLRTRAEMEFLVRIDAREASTEFLNRYAKKVGSYPNFQVTGEDTSCILGPVNEPQLKEWTDSGYLTASALVQKPFDRWKEIGTVFPDWIFRMGVGEFTQTGEFDSDSDERDSTRSGRELIRDVDITIQIPESIVQRTSVRNVINQKSASDSSDRVKAVPPPLSPTFIAGIVFVGVITIVGIFYVGGGKFRKNSTVNYEPIKSVPTQNVEITPSPGVVLESDWPANLRPLSYEEIKSGSEFRLKSVASVLSSFERGMRTLDERDSVTLRRAADPGAASFDGRKVASNLLAAFLFLDQKNLKEARALLEGARELDPKDPITLINLGLLEYSERNYPAAIENFQIVYRLRRDAYDWLMSSLIGLALFEQGKNEEANQNFNEALNRRPSNPIIYGLWIKGLLGNKKAVSSEVNALLQKALWSDFDILRDSPLPAPIFIPYIDVLYDEGWAKALKMPGLNLSAGKKLFIEWFQARDRPTGKVWNDLRELLVRDDDVQSKFLLAYMLKESGRSEEAGDVLLKSIGALSGERTLVGSAPWSFAGELLLRRGSIDEAARYFNAALEKNQTDAAALNGLAVIARSLGNYSTAEQKFDEASSLDHFFIPAKMRVSRSKWQDRFK